MKLAQKYARGDARIRVVAQSRQIGFVQKLQSVHASAKGTYIKLFAQDDILMPNIIEKSVAVLEHAPTVTLVTSNKKELRENGETIAKPLFDDDRVEPGEKIALDLLTGFKNFVGEPATATFRRSAMDGGFDHSYFHLGDTEIVDSPASEGRVLLSARTTDGVPSPQRKRFQSQSTRLALRRRLAQAGQEIHRISSRQ